ncbi:hypothetical protein [Caballeronia sp. Lep1P3]|nr:hypothetical protein [Caballeronia sp. Lep1P3]
MARQWPVPELASMQRTDIRAMPATDDFLNDEKLTVNAIRNIAADNQP